MKTSLNKEMSEELIRFQGNEKIESIVYERLALIERDESGHRVLCLISVEEEVHYATLEKYTGAGVAPNRMRIAKYYWLVRVLSITSAIKLMESSEENAYHDYAEYIDFPDLQQLAKGEKTREQKLIGLIDEERLGYVGSVVFGLNNASVEFTGAPIGLASALSDFGLIVLTGSITGIAAALSMALSEYLSTKSEGGENKHPVKAAIYTRITYTITVAALVTPFILIENVLIALGVMLAMALVIIALFSYYYFVARGESSRRRFIKVAVLSFSVAGTSFPVGCALGTFTGIDA